MVNLEAVPKLVSTMGPLDSAKLESILMPTCPIPGFEGFTEPEGLGTNGVLILGEAAGENEVADSLPFRPNAPAGSVLERAIKRSGFNRNQFVVFNVVPARPPHNHLEGARYEGEAIAWGLPYVRDVIARFKPSVVLCLGNVALKATTGLTGIVENRGYPIASTVLGLPVIASLHPAFLRRGAMAYLSVLMHDLKFAVAFAGALRQSESKLKGAIREDGPGANVNRRSPSGPGNDVEDNPKRVFPNGPLSLASVNPQPAAYTTIRVTFWSPVLWREVSYEIPQPLPSLYDVTAPTGYVCYPTESDALEFEMLCAEHTQTMLAYDIETPYVKGEENDPESSEIKSIQFSLAPETGIFMPWRAPFDEIARRILALRNPKIGANNWRFDRPILQSNGCVINGLDYDLRWMWKHLQPDLSGGLSFIGSFYAPEISPWKHLSTNDPVYGIKDIDILQRII